MQVRQACHGQMCILSRSLWSPGREWALWGPYSLCSNYSIPPLWCESSQRLYVNEWMWPRSNKTLSIKIGCWLPYGFLVPCNLVKSTNQRGSGPCSLRTVLWHPITLRTEFNFPWCSQALNSPCLPSWLHLLPLPPLLASFQPHWPLVASCALLGYSHIRPPALSAPPRGMLFPLNFAWLTPLYYPRLCSNVTPQRHLFVLLCLQ